MFFDCHEDPKDKYKKDRVRDVLGLKEMACQEEEESHMKKYRMIRKEVRNVSKDKMNKLKRISKRSLQIVLRPRPRPGRLV